MSTPTDTTEERQGEWMHTSLGNRFYPADPRSEDIFMSDIANGLALDCRYGGQGQVTKFYSVAEHAAHMSVYAFAHSGDPRLALAALLHDAAEAWINDLVRAVKHSAGSGYGDMEDRIQSLVYEKYDCIPNQEARAYIKGLDCMMVPLEKAAIMRHPQPWAYDSFEPLIGVEILCLTPPDAKSFFIDQYVNLCGYLGRPIEEYEL